MKDIEKDKNQQQSRAISNNLETTSENKGLSMMPPPFQFKSLKGKEDEKKSPVQKKSKSNGMPENVQTKMETAFGQDFSNVNIHTNSGSAKDMGALAYAQGNDVHFASGQYNPQSQKGQELIGHELTHVVQQREGRVKPTTQAKGVAVNDDKRLEKEADDMGAKVAQCKIDGSFPQKIEEDNKKKSIQKKNSSGVVQMRGGAKVGELCINTNVVNGGLTDGHAWLSYQPTGGSVTTYGTWGNRNPVGLHRDIELSYSPAATRCTDLDATDYSNLESFATSNNEWGYINNCASFAARGWRTVTGESVSYRTAGIPNPSALGGGISGLGGTLVYEIDNDNQSSSL